MVRRGSGIGFLCVGGDEEVPFMKEMCRK